MYTTVVYMYTIVGCMYTTVYCRIDEVGNLYASCKELGEKIGPIREVYRTHQEVSWCSFLLHHIQCQSGAKRSYD